MTYNVSSQTTCYKGLLIDGHLSEIIRSKSLFMRYFPKLVINWMILQEDRFLTTDTGILQGRVINSGFIEMFKQIV